MRNQMKSTTMNLDKAVCQEINKAAEFYDVTRIYLVKKIIKKIDIFYNKIHIWGKLKMYQDHSPDKGWKCFHYQLSNEECDLFANVSHRLKISISKLILIGFVLFFKQILRKLEKRNNSEKIIYSYTLLNYKYYYIVQKSVYYLEKNRRKQEGT